MQHAHDIDSYARRPSAEILYKGNNSAVIRIFSEKYNSVVVKKKHLDEYPSLRESNKFMKEVRMGQKLAHSEYIIKYYAKEGTGRDETIVMEDFAAVSIETAISKYVRCNILVSHRV
jgi:serine/threonine protein kinase